MENGIYHKILPHRSNDEFVFHPAENGLAVGHFLRPGTAATFAGVISYILLLIHARLYQILRDVELDRDPFQPIHPCAHTFDFDHITNSAITGTWSEALGS